MGYTRTDYYETIIQRHIRSGRASNKSEVIHQALALLDAVTQGGGPEGASFRNAAELEAKLLFREAAASHHKGGSVNRCFGGAVFRCSVVVLTRRSKRAKLCW
jgi:Arc/MetJ-type ribon-helix-helix transcriptional regulator